MKSLHFFTIQGVTCLIILFLGSRPANAQPANDMFVNRTTISGTNITAYGSNSGATKELGEPNHGGDTGGASVWWTWRAPTSGNVRVSTTGSNFDTLLGIYTGSSVGALTLLAGNDDDPDAADRTSACIFAAVAGVNYQIAVDGWGGAIGSITLKVQQPPPPPPPPYTAPAWQSPDPYGVLVRYADFAGKVVIFNFWATWCGPCRAEMPDLVDLHNEYNADGLVVIGADITETSQTVINFLATFTPTITYPIILADSTTQQAFGGPGGISAIPKTYIIDRRNFIRRSYLGTQSRSTFESAIIPLLYETTRLECKPIAGQNVLCWSIGVRPFTLESTTDLVNPSWTPWPTQPTPINGTNTVQVPTGGNYYFRLRMSY